MRSYYSPQPSERPALLRKVVLLFLLVTALALGLVILFREQPGFPFLLQHSLATAVIAIGSAISSRMVLSRRHVLIRFLAALAAFLVGLYVLGLASDWKFGIGPLDLRPRTVDWDGLAQVGLGIYLFLLIFRAWRRPATPPRVIEVTPRYEPELSDIRPEALPTPRRSRHSHRASSDTRRKADLSFAPGITPSAPSVRVRRATRKRRNGAVRTLTAADLPIRPKPRRRKGSRPHVQFAVVEDHRCPFCLDSVSRADPRGVVECEVCHALHHKDCWDITGVCQVPHLNT